MAAGLAQVLPAGCLTVIVNVGDDFEHLGLYICPDLDTVCYTLAGLANPQTGWGAAQDTWQALEVIAQLGGPDWFRLGDRDLGLHLERTRRLAAGEPLSSFTRSLCQRWGIAAAVLPASDERLPTWVLTDEGELPFQEYFVHRQCEPRVKGFRFAGAEHASPAPGVVEAVLQADLLLICPSNPWVSIDPILAIPGIRSAFQESSRSGSAVALAVSPIIRGGAVKGPAAKMYAELGIVPSPLAVARHYLGLIQGFVLDEQDRDFVDPIAAEGILPFATDTLMPGQAERLRLAGAVLEFGRNVKSNYAAAE